MSASRSTTSFIMQPVEGIVDPDGERVIFGRRVPVVAWGSARAVPFSTSFEEAAARLEQLPRLFLEPDGALLWAGESAAGERWQLEANLFDRDGQLVYLQCLGWCPEEAFERFRVSIAAADTRLTYQLIRQGVLLEEHVFRQLWYDVAGDDA